MNQIVVYESFPEEQYQLVEQLSAQEGLRVAQYRDISQQINYLILTYTFKQLPKRIADKIIKQIQQYNDYEECCLTAINKAYIYKGIEGTTKITLKVKSLKEQTLQHVIKQKKYTPSVNQKIANLLQLSENLTVMHRSGHAHGCIKLSNITYRDKQSYIALGMPVYIQIQKWRIREEEIRHNTEKKYQSSKKIQWQRPSFSTDIFNLGVVFLQMCLNQLLPQILNIKDAQSYLSKIEHPTFQYIIRKMITQDHDHFSMKEVVQSIQNWEKNKISSPLQINENCLCLSLFNKTTKLNKANARQIILSRIEIFKKFDFGTAIFTFIENICYLNLILSEGKQQLSLDISEQVRKIIKSKGYNIQRFIQNLKQETLIKLTTQGCIEIQNKKSIIKPFDKGCKIIQENTIKSGLIINQNLVITSAYSFNATKTHFSFETNLCKIQNEKYYDVWTAQEVADKELTQIQNFCLASFNLNITLGYFPSFLKLLKNYSESIILEKISKLQEQKLSITYQLGRKKISKDQISFSKDYFKLGLINMQIMSILSGQPLVLELPSRESVVIGIYNANGVGFLFTDSIYWSIYRLIVKCWGQVYMLTNSIMSFIFIECTEFNINQGQIKNISRRYHSSEDMQQDTMLSKVVELQKGKQMDQRDKGYYYYLFSRINQIKKDMGMAYVYFEKALQCYSSFYEGKDNFICAILLFNIGQNLSLSSLDHLDHNQTIFYLQSAIEMLRRSGFNPFLLIFCISYILRLKEYSNELHLQNISISKQLGFIRALRMIYLDHTKQQQWGKYLTQLDQLQTYSVSKLKFDFEKNIQRTQKTINNCNLNTQYLDLVIERLEQLHARQLKEGKEDDQRVDKLKQIWKSSIVIFIGLSKNLRQIQQLEALSKKYYDDDGYHSVKDSFRKKEVILKKAISQQ